MKAIPMLLPPAAQHAIPVPILQPRVLLLLSVVVKSGRAKVGHTERACSVEYIHLLLLLVVSMGQVKSQKRVLVDDPGELLL
jgi:hypothetical protein